MAPARWGNRNSHGSSTRGISFTPNESTIQHQTEKIKMLAVAMSTTSTSKGRDRRAIAGGKSEFSLA
jgi:hypothetical protein